MRTETKPTPPEALLLRYVRQLGDQRLAQRALHFHLSGLQKQHRQDQHLRIAANMLEDLVLRFDGRIFLLQSGDIVLTCRGARRKTLEGSIEIIRYLFNDDPLAWEESPREDFCSLYDLESDYDRFLAAVKRINEALVKPEDEALPGKRNGAPRQQKQPLDPEHLGEVLATINRADLANLIRCQTVWMMAPGAAPEPMFDELFVSIEELGNALAPNYRLASDRWLFQYLTQSLDRRVLSMLVREYPAVPRGLSLNINLATLLSPDFLRFEDYLPVRARGNVILELQLADVWSDFGAFLFAANMVKQREYRLCLDAVKHTALPLIDADRLGVDFVKLIWDDALLSIGDEDKQQLRRLVAESGSAQVILIRCDSAEAVAFGQSAGIRLFQGWYTDRRPQAR